MLVKLYVFSKLLILVHYLHLLFNLAWNHLHFHNHRILQNLGKSKRIPQIGLNSEKEVNNSGCEIHAN